MPGEASNAIGTSLFLRNFIEAPFASKRSCLELVEVGHVFCGKQAMKLRVFENQPRHLPTADSRISILASAESKR